MFNTPLLYMSNKYKKIVIFIIGLIIAVFAIVIGLNIKSVIDSNKVILDLESNVNEVDKNATDKETGKTVDSNIPIDTIYAVIKGEDVSEEILKNFKPHNYKVFVDNIELLSSHVNEYGDDLNNIINSINIQMYPFIKGNVNLEIIEKSITPSKDGVKFSVADSKSGIKLFDLRYDLKLEQLDTFIPY